MTDENQDNPENPEISIDEGWKAQVEKERQKAEAEPQGEAAAPEQTPEEPEYELTLFDSLVSGLAAQTMVALGLTGEEGEQVQVDIGYAHHLISTMIMLREKTEGKLEDGEKANLDEAIGELHRVFMIREEQVREVQNQASDNIHKLHIPGQD